MAHTNGTLYAIPLDTHPLVMYYNTDICKKAGLLGKDGSLKNLDDPAALTDALTAAKKVTGAYGGVVSINNDTATPWRFFSTLYYQLGGSVLEDDGKKIVLDDAKAKRSCRSSRTSSSRASYPRAWTTPARSPRS